jgi:hypothetical protein
MLCRYLATGLFLVLLAPACVEAATPSQSTINCGLYEKLDRLCQCPAGANYLKDYGFRYCERFRQATAWTPAGRTWRDETLLCLQKELKQLTPGDVENCNCARLQDDAFNSHAYCYTQHRASFCSLPNADVFTIYGIIDGRDLWSGIGLRQGLAIFWNCLTGKFPREQ